MILSMLYNSSLTVEQYLFGEIRIVSRQLLMGKSVGAIVEYVKQDNLFQYPTERKISQFFRSCFQRIVALDNNNLVRALANVPG